MLFLSIITTAVFGLHTEGKTFNKIRIREEERKFLLYYPKNFTNKLWVLLHGHPGHAKHIFHYTDFFFVAEDKGFVLLVLQGRCIISYFCYFNTGSMKGPFDSDWSKDDIEYIDQVIETFFEFSGFDKHSTQIVITGHSAGAFMSYTYAINTTKHKIHAVAGVAGHIGGESHPADRPIRRYDPNLFGIQGDYLFNVIMVFGDKDTLVKIRGSDRGRKDFSLDQDIEFFLRENDCLNSTEEIYYDMNEISK
jgi:poly(3-hydroxybutyrate) depolymerase